VTKPTVCGVRSAVLNDAKILVVRDIEVAVAVNRNGGRETQVAGGLAVEVPGRFIA
jgi:hypothetical protein